MANQLVDQLFQSESNHTAVSRPRKLQRYRSKIAIACLMISGAMGILLASMQQANLRHQAKTAEEMLAKDPTEGLILAIQAVGQDRFKPIGQMLPEVQSSLLKAVQTAKELSRFNFQNHVYAVAFSEDGQTIAAAGAGNAVQLWNIQEDSSQRLEGKSQSIRAIAFSPSGRTLIGTPAIDSGELVQMWDLPSHALYQTPATAQVISTAFDPHGKFGVSGTIDGRVFLWNRLGHLVAQLAPIQDAKVTAVALNGSTIASGSADGRISLWNLKGEALGRLQAGASVISLNLSSNGQRMIAQTSQGQQAFLWDTATRQWKRTSLNEASNSNAADLSPNHATIARGYKNGKIELLPLHAPASPALAHSFVGHQEAVTAVQFSPDGGKLLSGSQDGTVRLWEMRDSILQDRYLISGWEAPNPESIALSANGQRMIRRNADGTIRFSNVKGNLIHQFNNPTQNQIRRTAISSNGKRIVIYSDHAIAQKTTTQIYILDTDTKTSQQIKQISEPIHAITLSSEGEQIAIVNPVGQLSLLDQQGNVIKQVAVADKVTQIAFSPHQKTIAIGTQNGMIRFWNLQTNQVSSPIKTQLQSIHSIAFSPDGQTIATGGADGTVQLLNMTGKLIGYPLGKHQAEVRSVAFSPDGKQLISLSQDGEVRVWQVNWEAWLKTACNRLQNHPALQNPTRSEAQNAKIICQTQVWGLTNANKPLALRRMSPYLLSTSWLANSAQETRLIVKRGERRVYVYQGNSLKASYPIAVGQPGWETPIGKFHVSQMLRDPAWTHPITREVFPSGQNNPLGDRWIAFWTDGSISVGFHGTPDRASVGQAASHGCLRMLNEDVRALYELVQLGTVVTVEP